MNARCIGPYLIEGLLGSGGIGQVYAALDQDLGRRVALKALRPEYGSDPDILERFRNEAASLARLNHPNITILYSLFRQPETERQGDCMVMEIVDGETLEALLQRLGRITTRGSLAVAAQAALGLSYAHASGIIHRDIKPSNLMLDAAGMLKITDFGIARVQGSQRLTRHGTLVGTLSYIAPEQIKGHEADERSDLYSLACVLYELLSGEKPFSGSTEYELIRAHLEAEARPLGDAVPGLDPDVAQAIRQALAKEPADRFASVAEFAEAVGATALAANAATIVQKEVLAAAGPPPPANAAAGRAAEEQASSAACMAATVVSTLPDEPERRAARCPKRRRAMVAGGVALALCLAAGAYAGHALRSAPSPAPGTAAGRPPEAAPRDDAPAPAPPHDPAQPDPGTGIAPAPVALPSPQADMAPAQAPQVPGPGDGLAGGEHDAAAAGTAQPGTEAQLPVPAEAGPRPGAAADGPQDRPPTPPDRRAIAGQVSSFSPGGWPVVGGVAIHLEGVGALEADQARPVASWIAAHGGYLACSATLPDTYRCLTRQRLDLAQVILLNGAAKVAANAGSFYRDAEAQARAARRGLWR